MDNTGYTCPSFISLNLINLQFNNLILSRHNITFLKSTENQENQQGLLKRILLGAAPAECRLVPRSATLRLDRNGALTDIALGLTSLSRLHCPQAVTNQHDITANFKKNRPRIENVWDILRATPTKLASEFHTIMIGGKKLSEALFHYFISLFHYF